jgi:TonB dependent receptor/TonB-dependent Receptor Plug Domain
MPPDRSRRDTPLTARAGILSTIGIASILGSIAARAGLPPEPAATDSRQALQAVTPLGMTLGEVTITAERLELLGSAASASEGVVADHELQLTPAYRPGQLLETVPGLIVTLHSGEGKANQFLMRGYNLDHGTDLATFVDGMPVNQPTHAHGQGYTDLNFLIPELADAIAYTKGPYYASVGDFGAVGSVRVRYRDSVADQLSVSAGTLDYQRYLATGSASAGGGKLLAAAELQHYDGPFLTPDDARKQNGVVRYSRGDQHDGYSLTGMFYHQLWTSTTDIPLRAIDQRLVANRFGTLDPTDGGRAQRASLSLQYYRALAGGQFSASGYYIYNQLHMHSDFTHFLVDPLHGDQEDQFENRHAFGGTADYTRPLPLGAIGNEISAGAVTRYDSLSLGRLPSEARTPQPQQADPASFSNSDQVVLFSAAAYLQATTRWSSKLRSVLGIRADYQHGSDVDYLAALHQSAGYSNSGSAGQWLLQPKGSLIFAAAEQLEIYFSAGQGFHSADLRGVNQARYPGLRLPRTPLLAKQDGQEIGLRAQLQRHLAFTLALYNLWQQSETVIDPDIGQDTSGPPSRRYGFEVNLSWQIRRWLELYGSYSGNHTRFTRDFDDGTGHLGSYITDAPVATGSLALYLTHLGRWSAGLDYRYLGRYALSSGRCVDAAAARDFPDTAAGCAGAPTLAGQVDGKGFGELNLDAHYGFRSGWEASLGIYNLLNSHAPAAQFWYVDRLKSEVGTYPNGRADIHQHPLEPVMARLSISRKFGS